MVLESEDWVELIDTKYLPPAWKLKKGMQGKVSHLHSKQVAYVAFDDGHDYSQEDQPFYPLHVTRLLPL